MLILIANNILGSEEKYLELYSTIQVIKPDYVSLIGNILPETQTEQSVDRTLEVLDVISEICPTLIQFSGNDWKCYENMFHEKNKNKNIINLEKNTLTTEDGISLCGINTIPDTPLDLKDWTRKDGNNVYNNVQYGSAMCSLDDKLEKFPDFKKQIDELPSIGDIIKKKIETIEDVSKSIWFSYATPAGLNGNLYNKHFSGSYDIRRLAEGDLSDSVQPISVVSTMTNFDPHINTFCDHQIKDCRCINIGNYGRGLNYSVIGIVDYKVDYTFFSKNILRK